MSSVTCGVVRRDPSNSAYARARPESVLSGKFLVCSACMMAQYCSKACQVRESPLCGMLCNEGPGRNEGEAVLTSRSPVRRRLTGRRSTRQSVPS